jgi:ribose transport system substrate-binding protein
MKEEQRRMKVTRRFAALLSVALLTLTLAPATVSAQDEKPKIGFLPGIEDPFYRVMEKGVNAAAADFGFEVAAVAYPPAPWGAASQTPLLDAMVARGDLDYIITAPTSAEEMIAPLQAAYEKGIGIVGVDTFIGDGNYIDGPVTFPISLLASDNVEGGRIVGHAMAAALGETGEVYIQNTNAETSTVQQRSQGFREAIAEYPDMTIADEQYCLDDPVLAAQQTSAVLEAHPNVKGIFGVNVFSAEGAGNAVETAGLAGSVQVAAWDATDFAIELLDRGTVTMVLAQKPFDMGYMAVAFALADRAGVTSIPKHVTTGFQVITQENMDDPEVAKYFYKFE